MASALILALLAGVPAESTFRGVHVTASLLAEQAWIRPGRPLTVGLRLQMDPEWHTYWRNPGDSGLPTRIRWTLPAGFEAGPIAWPSPERFAAAPLASYGYAGEVLLLSEIRAPAQAPPGSAVVIAARADWLECRDVCRPGKAELSLRLDVKDEEPRREDRWAKAFADARARLPKARAPWTFQGSAGAAGLALQARGAAPPPRQAYFFSSASNLVEHGEEQALQAEKGGFRLRLPLNPNAKRPDRLEGVLVADGVGFELVAPVSSPKGVTQ